MSWYCLQCRLVLYMYWSQRRPRLASASERRGNILEGLKGLHLKSESRIDRLTCAIFLDCPACIFFTVLYVPYSWTVLHVPYSIVSGDCLTCAIFARQRWLSYMCHIRSSAVAVLHVPYSLVSGDCLACAIFARQWTRLSAPGCRPGCSRYFICLEKGIDLLFGIIHSLGSSCMYRILISRRYDTHLSPKSDVKVLCRTALRSRVHWCVLKASVGLFQGEWFVL